MRDRKPETRSRNRVRRGREEGQRKDRSSGPDVPKAVTLRALADPRCPKVGSTIQRTVTTASGPKTLAVRVTSKGFVWNGRTFASLTPIVIEFGQAELGWSKGTRRDGWEWLYPDRPIPENLRIGRRADKPAKAPVRSRARRPAPAAVVTEGHVQGPERVVTQDVQAAAVAALPDL